MTSTSLAMAVPAARRDICNSLMEALGRGPDTFRIELEQAGSLVGYGAHSWDMELAQALQSGTLPPGVTLADLQAHGFTASSAQTAAGYIRKRVFLTDAAFDNFMAKLADEGWTLRVAVDP